ncbi:hypothetical protein [Phenylobacterium sp.]|uniref:hypothetical protein n=1 Tax=Phenylobacterium sp. TaxID=1871053 RepID=UPI0025EBB3FF|nr:hypothetical protein [Phenylobacterium sp.]
MRRALILALGTTLAASGLAQAGPAAKGGPPIVDPTIPQPGWAPPKTAWGQPDLSGYWSNATLTPLTRNPRLTDKVTLSPAEARATAASWAKALEEADAPTDPKASTQTYAEKPSESKLLAIRPDFAAAGGDVGGYNAFWLDPGANIMEVNGEFRTSILTTPNGQPPARKGSGSGGGSYGQYRDLYDSYETRALGERCIMGFGRNATAPMLPNGFYNNNYQIVQTPDSVVIQVEMIHEARIVRLGAQHRTDGVRPWMGDSVGHYEGNTLVVETTNFPQREGFMGSWKTLKVTEWFTRVSPTRINYRFQLDDADTWDKPWGGEYDFSPLKGIIYEYACHEGNYALPAILAGARHQEQQAAEVAAAKAAAPVAEPTAAPSKGKRGAD